MKKGDERVFAVTAPGLEAVCARELAALGILDCRPVTGGVEFVGGLAEIYRANLCLRTATRILVRLGEVGARDFPDLFAKVKRLPWGKFVRPSTPLAVRAVSHRSRLVHSGRIAETIAAAADRALGRSGPPAEGSAQQVVARFEEDRCLISVDASGDLLHRRGYRLRGVRAPLRETLAAGMLLLLDWQGETPLLDPMCGSGTLAIEGALIARRMAPGRGRIFAFMDWPGFRPGLWQTVLAAADKGVLSQGPLIAGADREPSAVAVAAENAARAGVGSDIEWHCRDLTAQRAPAANGLLLCNPPYGSRLACGEDLRPLFRLFGELRRQYFAGWQIAFLVPDERLARATGLPLAEVAQFANGGIPVRLYRTRND